MPEASGLHRSSATDDLTAIDLFCGAGGLAVGLTQRGFDVALASDVWQPAADTYRANFPGHTFAQVDIRELSVESVLRACGGRPPRLVAGGPPCQGFSSAGARVVSDARNSLVGRYAQLAVRVAPEVVVFENVEGFLTAGGGRYVTDLLDPLVEAGYTVRMEKLNVANYGVPQLRKRVIAIAARNRLPAPLRPTNSAAGAPGVWRVGAGLPPTVSTDDALSAVRADDSDPLSLGREPGPLELARIRALRPGQTMRDLPEHLQHESWSQRANRRVRDGLPTERRGGAPIGLRRLVGSEPSKAVTGAATREFVHPAEDRTLSLREAACLQTFPGDFRFAGTRADVATMIGNAIPPTFAAALAGAVRETLASDAQDVAPGVMSFRATSAEAMSPALARVAALVDARYDTPQSKLALF